MTKQLSFNWPANVSLEAQDFFVSEANRAAHTMVMRPDDWPRGKLCLTGPAACGKSHMARVLAEAIGAQIMHAPDITATTPLPDPAPMIIEDADRLPAEAEEWLFHLHNALSGRAPLLLTARSDPARWPIRLPDLASRMQATTIARIGPPDDALLTTVLMKLFADRQIAPEPELPGFLAMRLDRSFAALSNAVTELDQAALATGRPVGRRLASDWLADRL